MVADPFMGSGSVGVAALKLGRRFLGNDLNPEAVAIAEKRLRERAAPDAPDAAGPQRRARPTRDDAAPDEAAQADLLGAIADRR
jgi:site-specific DNA-methyltransferase (adenine-specific)